MKFKILIIPLMLALIVQACNIPTSPPVTETPTASASPSPTQPQPTDTPTVTPSPTSTPPPTLTFTPSVPIAFPRDTAVNCRLGPGQAWAVISGLNPGQTSQILGKNSDGTWWYIVDPFNSGRNCWVSTSVVNTAGNLTTIPIVQTPTASVTNVTVRIDPTTVNAPGLCAGPILPSRIEGTIETNGPTTVRWYFETQQGGQMSTETTVFDSFGTKTFSTNYTPAPLVAGRYLVRLIVTSPNATQAETSYNIVCAP
jgi:uncharacterized protein YraI